MTNHNWRRTLKTMCVIVLSLLVLNVSNHALIIAPVEAASSTILSMTPLNTVVDAGTTFKVNVTIQNVQQLYGYQFGILYDTNMLTATDLAPHQGTTNEPGFFHPTYQIWYHLIDDDPWGNGTGRVYIAVTPPIGTPQGRDGNGTLATVQFSADASGRTALRLAQDKLTTPGSVDIPHIVVSGTATVAPFAFFAYSPLEPDLYETLTFNASESTDAPPGTITTYIWDFGDGNTTTLSTPIIYHTYAGAGAFTVNLTVIDNDLLTDSMIQIVRIKPLRAEPNIGPVGTKVTIYGAGFNDAAGWSGEIYFDDQIVGWNLRVSGTGTFTFAFNIPVSEPGIHDIKVNIYYYTSSVPGAFNITQFTVIDQTPLEVGVEVGKVHFRGEIAEFYIQTALKGKQVNATSIHASLYKSDNTTEDLSVRQIATGLYKARQAQTDGYQIAVDASVGTYVLVVEAHFLPDSGFLISYIDSRGTAFGSFLVSATLTGWNAWLVQIQGDVAIIRTDVGIVKADVATIMPQILSIEGTVATLNTTMGRIQTDVANIKATMTALDGDIATIQTAVGGIQGTVTSISGNVATIKTDVGTIKTTLQDWTSGATSSIVTPDGTYKLLTISTSNLVSDPVFADNMLEIKVDGQTGTQGKTNIIMPIQLLQSLGTSIDKVAVTIDGNTLEFDYKNVNGIYVLMTVYTQSAHTLRVYLAGIPPGQIPYTIIIAAIAIIVVIAIGVAVYMFKLRKPKAN